MKACGSPRTPKGWRELKPGTPLRLQDRYWSYANKKWTRTENPPGFPAVVLKYIRRIKK